MNTWTELPAGFYQQDCLELAPALVGKYLARRLPDGTVARLRITETEAYRGEEDTACHAHKGRTPRTEPLYGPPGRYYIYLCYGIHWLLNVVSGAEGQPQGVLIRACEGFPGPGRLTRRLGITGTLNGAPCAENPELWLETDGSVCAVSTDTRVGIAYAAPEDQARLWRFKLK